MKHYCLLLLCSITISLHAQKRGQARIDSLLQVIPAINSDTSRIKILIEIANSYADVSPVKGIDYGEQAAALSRTTNFTRGLIDAYQAIGLNNKIKADYTASIDAYAKSITLSESINDKKSMGVAYSGIGSAYLLQGAYPKALEYYLKGLKINEDISYKPGMASAIGNVGNVYSYLINYDKALEYYERALHLQEELGNKQGIAANSGNAGYIYLYQKNYDKALVYINRALQLNEQIGSNSGIIGNNQGLGRIYLAQHNYIKAVESFDKSLAIAEKLGNKISIAQNLLTIAEVYLAVAKDSVPSPFTGDLSTRKGLLAKALANANRAIALRTEIKDMNGLNFAYDTRSEIELAAGDAVAALASYKEHMRYRDTVFNAEKTSEINRRELQYEFGKREDSLKLEQAVTSNKLLQQQFIGKQQQQQLTLKQQQLLLVSKEKDLQRLSYLQKQAQLQREAELQESLLEKNKLQSRLSKEASDKEIAQQKLQIDFEQKVKLYLIIAVFLVLLVAFLIYNNQRKTKNLNRIINKQKEELEELGGVKDRIFSVVSHDMRTPVNTLISFIDILEDDAISTDKLQAYAGELKNQLTHTSVLMENLLNWASSQMKGFTLTIEKTDVKNGIDETISVLQQQAAYKNIRMINHAPAGNLAAADKNMLALVIRNLLSNAIKFTPADGLIEIRSAKHDHMVQISIADNGTGMNASKADSFNDATYLNSIDSKRGTQGETGTGLGLMLCKTFVTLMKGRISVESREGKGTVFTILLPAA